MLPVVSNDAGNTCFSDIMLWNCIVKGPYYVLNRPEKGLCTAGGLEGASRWSCKGATGDGWSFEAALMTGLGICVLCCVVDVELWCVEVC